MKATCATQTITSSQAVTFGAAALYAAIGETKTSRKYAGSVQISNSSSSRASIAMSYVQNGTLIQYANGSPVAAIDAGLTATYDGAVIAWLAAIPTGVEQISFIVTMSGSGSVALALTLDTVLATPTGASANTSVSGTLISQQLSVIQNSTSIAAGAILTLTAGPFNSDGSKVLTGAAFIGPPTRLYPCALYVWVAANVSGGPTTVIQQAWSGDAPIIFDFPEYRIPNQAGNVSTFVMYVQNLSNIAYPLGGCSLFYRSEAIG